MIPAFRSFRRLKYAVFIFFPDLEAVPASLGKKEKTKNEAE